MKDKNVDMNTSLSRDEYHQLIMAKENLQYLRRFISRRVKDPQEIDDIAQSTLLVALRVFENFRGHSSIRTWLCGIAANVIRDNQKERDKDNRYLCYDISSECHNLQTQNVGVAEDPADTYVRLSELNDVQERYNNMTQKLRDIVNYLVVDGHTYQQASEKFDIPIGTVRSRFWKAREILKDRSTRAA